MASIFEKSYGKVFKTALRAVNPIKKIVVKTECKVHKFINKQSIVILKNDGNTDAYRFFYKHIEDLNSGVVWADQDLKSSSHFYNPEKKKGLYGCSNALKECISYYAAALTYWNSNDYRKSIFYLGAACHLIQDVTVPQHVNVKLLKKHRKYEKWVIKVYESNDSFKCFNNGLYFDSIKEFIEDNAMTAINAYNKSKTITNIYNRYYNITDIILCQAQRSTAGLLNMFYVDVCDMKEKRKECTI